jgi:hypothetical protein
MTGRQILRFLVLCLMLSRAVVAQDSQRTLTNADVVNMVKSGIGDQTIILTIQKGATKFDTSPNGLIELKKAGVSDAVLDSMLSARPAATNAEDAQGNCAQSLDGALAFIGSRDKITAIHSIRYTAQQIITSPSGSSSNSMERVTVFPFNVYVSHRQSDGQSTKLVFTPEFNYLTSGHMTTALPVSTIQDLQIGTKLDPIYVSQHRENYSCFLEDNEPIGNLGTIRLKIAGEGVEGYWNIDPATDRLLRITYVTSGLSQSADYSDWRQVDGVYFSFVRHGVRGGVTTDITVNDFDVNPVTDANLFAAPAGQPSTAVTLKVLQSESVPYVVQSNGGISTACNITGSTYTSMNSSTYGNNTYGTATSTPNLQMNCRSSDTTIRWTHVLNAMFVEGSDGVDYIIACDRAWRWSKCTPLKAGDTFLAQRGSKGFVVQSFNTKSKEQEETYSVLQSKSARE